jgi:hypothetical protein
MRLPLALMFQRATITQCREANFQLFRISLKKQAKKQQYVTYAR